MQIEENRIELNGIQINYAQAGTGKAIIFLHNGGGFWQTWYYQIKHFSENYSVYAIDWPGFGESELPEKSITLQLLTKTLEEFIKKLDLNHVILVGNCIGASVALQYNIEYPEKVDKLILMNICPGKLLIKNKLVRKLIQASNTKPILKKILGSILVFSFTKTPIKLQFPKILFGNNYSTSYLSNKYTAIFKTVKQTQARVDLLFSIYTYTLKQIISNKTIPSNILLWGKDNKVASKEDFGYYHKELLCPEVYEEIEDSGHLCMYENPINVNELINRYIEADT